MEQIDERVTKENVYICVTLSIKLCRPKENSLVDASLYLAVDVHRKPGDQSLLNVYRHGVSASQNIWNAPPTRISQWLDKQKFSSKFTLLHHRPTNTQVNAHKAGATCVGYCTGLYVEWTQKHMSDWRDSVKQWLLNMQPLEWPVLSANKWNLTSTSLSSSDWFSKKVGINQDSIITPLNIQSDSVSTCFSTVENADLQSTQEDLSPWGHDPPLLWWLGQIQPACCQHQLNLKVYTHPQNLYIVNL